MKPWLTLALLGLLFLPACNSQPSAGGPGQPTDAAQSGSTATTVKGYIMPGPSLPNPVFTAQWSKFRESSSKKFDDFFPEFPDMATKALNNKIDPDKLMIANQNLGYVGITLHDIQCTTLDSYYSALFTLDSIKDVGLTPNDLPEVFDLLNSIVKTAEPIVEPPADLDSDLAVCDTYIKRHLVTLGDFYANNDATPTQKILAFNRSAIKFIDLIQRSASYSELLIEANQTLNDVDQAIAEGSIEVASLRCVSSALKHITTRLQVEGKATTSDASASESAPSAAATSTGQAQQQSTNTASAQPNKPDGAVADSSTSKSATATSGKMQYPLDKTITTKSGLQITIQRAGKGANCKSGQMVSVHYQGTFTDGQIFDSSYTRRLPLEFPLGLGYVIDGLEEGVLGMQVGEKRHLVVPPSLGYGSQGSGPIPPNARLILDVELQKRNLVVPPSLGCGSQGSGPIPPNATLIFDIELLKIE